MLGESSPQLCKLSVRAGQVLKKFLRLYSRCHKLKEGAPYEPKLTHKKVKKKSSAPSHQS